MLIYHNSLLFFYFSFLCFPFLISLFSYLLTLHDSSLMLFSFFHNVKCLYNDKNFRTNNDLICENFHCRVAEILSTNNEFLRAAGCVGGGEAKVQCAGKTYASLQSLLPPPHQKKTPIAHCILFFCYVLKITHLTHTIIECCTLNMRAKAFVSNWLS